MFGSQGAGFSIVGLREGRWAGRQKNGKKPDWTELEATVPAAGKLRTSPAGLAPVWKGTIMKTLRLPLLLVSASLAIAPVIASANPATTCADRTKVLSRLAADFGETRQSIGLGANNALIEVFASDQTGTWTITVTRPNGTTCLIASGQAFEALTEDLAKVLENDV